MKIKSNLSFHLSYLGFLLALIIFNKGVQGQSKYSSYPDYSALTQRDTISSVTATADLPKNMEMISDRSLEVNAEASQNSHHTLNSEGKSGSQSVFYYEMFPTSAEKPQRPQQMCTYTGSGMKCQFKRDSTTSSVAHSTTSLGNTGTLGDTYAIPASSYNVPSNSYRDSSTSYSAPTSHYGAPSHEYGVPSDSYGPPSSPGGYGWSSDMTDTSSGGGLGGLVGLAGLFGLKGLKALFPLAFLLPLIPILIPLIIFMLLLPILPLILLLPIPLIVSPVTARGGMSEEHEVNFKTVNLKSMLQIASEVLESEECVQKLSCEMARMSRKYNVFKWADRFTEALPKGNRYRTKIRQGLMKNSTSTENRVKKVTSKELIEECSIFICKPRAIAAKYFAT